MLLSIFGLPTWVETLIFGVIGLFLLLISSKTILGWIFIKESENGIIVKKWGLGKSSRLPEGRIIATKGEAGIQAQMIGPGLHFGYWWWMYSVQKQHVIDVPTGSIGIIEAIDGDKLPSGSILACNVVECNNFQDAKAFIESGGQKGWQRNYLTPGQYRINTQLFKTVVKQAYTVPHNKIGLVTTQDGKPLSKEKIAGEIIDGHGHFQDADAFLKSGGYRGLQEQVLLPGTWYINPQFAEVELIAMTEIPVGFVGVVNSYIGGKGSDVSGESFKHGNIVKEGNKGIWEKTYDPGLYPINTRLMKVIPVPTTNIVLNWASGKTESHKLDADLSTINLRSKDGFTFSLDVSQVVNISNTSAPKVISRFGSVENMVSQVLEPTIGAYFRNSAQTSDALDFVEHRTERQKEAKKHIDETLSSYDIVGVDTLIGDIEPPADLMKILSDRKIAQQEQAMFEMQKSSQEKRQEFVKAQTAADKEKDLTTARYDKDIATQKADTKVETAKGDKESAKITAEGEAFVLTTVGEAKGKNITAIGMAEANVIEKKTSAMGKEQFAAVQVAEHLATNKIELVPKILVQGQNGDGGILSALIGADILKRYPVEKEETKEVSSEDTTGKKDEKK
jgi:uncharacterized membrane protein YqiK